MVLVGHVSTFSGVRQGGLANLVSNGKIEAAERGRASVVSVASEVGKGAILLVLRGSLVAERTDCESRGT